MKRYVEGQDRAQSTLFPEVLDDYIAEDNPVRVIDVFVEELDLIDLGFEGAEPEVTGRPAYHPGTMLKVYIYGYLNRIQSSRRLERETQRNVELIWLTGRLTPDFKTIADFRKDNGKAIQSVCREFVLLCRNLNLFSEALVAIDGSKFKAVNGLGKQMAQSSDEQISLTDPDARSMATSARGSGVVGYNVQSAVDAKHHLIVTHEVTNCGTDRAQLCSMGKQTQQALGTEKITALADRGYYAGPEILACEQAGINALVPKSHTSNNLAKGQFDKRDFHYIAADDEYRCPAGQRAIRRFTTLEHGQTVHKYWSSACPRCPIKAQCTSGKNRRIHAGSMRRCWKRCRCDWRRCPARRASADRPQNTYSAHSSPGWEPRISS